MQLGNITLRVGSDLIINPKMDILLIIRMPKNYGAEPTNLVGNRNCKAEKQKIMLTIL